MTLAHGWFKALTAHAARAFRCHERRVRISIRGVSGVRLRVR
jgi:hypothetical protein